MSNISARFVQTPNEVKRYLVDYTLDLAIGETLVSIGTPTVVPTPGQQVSPALVINSVVIAPGALQFAFFAQGGVNGNNYEVQFLVTTSLGQVRETVIAFNILGDL